MEEKKAMNYGAMDAGNRAVANDAEWLSNRRHECGFAYSPQANKKA
ncbi:hypothetical protein YWIDRAFT_01528 [Streptomyces sp. SceaMP-e96]|nr:hypothetical protein YWIDRAFT_01528 [Streptomyces sp. SceaMP-e96]